MWGTELPVSVSL